MNQALLVIGRNLKLYTLKHRNFQTAANTFMTQEQLGKLNTGFKKMPHVDISASLLKIVQAISRVPKSDNFQVVIA